jgi:multicomponent Na+:H+ antiporter subunit G
MPAVYDILIIVLLCFGCLFCVLTAVGILRMPDVYTRMQAASKSVTFGATSIVLAAALHFREGDIVARCLLVCVFLFVTIPAASYLVARVAYRSGEPLAPETMIDELGDRGRNEPGMGPD